MFANVDAVSDVGDVDAVASDVGDVDAVVSVTAIGAACGVVVRTINVVGY